MRIRTKRSALSSNYHLTQINFAAKDPLLEILVNTTAGYSVFSILALLITKKYAIAPTQ
jgi:hypothetical protein